MTSHDGQYWEQLAQDAENGRMTPDPTREALHGEAAAEAGRAMLREVFGTDDLDAISDEELRRGRPALGKQTSGEAGESPMLRLCVPAQMNEAMTNLSAARGKSKSELIRDWIAEGLRQAS